MPPESKKKSGVVLPGAYNAFVKTWENPSARTRAWVVSVQSDRIVSSPDSRLPFKPTVRRPTSASSAKENRPIASTTSTRLNADSPRSAPLKNRRPNRCLPSCIRMNRPECDFMGE